MTILWWICLFFSLYQVKNQCGNGIVESGEECDDGNNYNDDGCNSNCQIEKNFYDTKMYECEGSPSVCTYITPLAIPHPLFGISQTRYMYSYESGYEDAGNGPYTYYVDNSLSGCSDSSTIDDREDHNDLSNKGSPEKPRCRLPYTLQAGDVVEVHGGPYVYSNYGGNKFGIDGTGTIDQPIFVNGNDEALFEGREIHVLGEYIILEHIVIDDPNDVGIVQLRNNNNCFRHSEIIGTDESRDGSAVISYQGTEKNVFFHNHIHNRGNWNDGTQENDYMGIGMSSDTQDIWVLDNYLHHLGGDSVGTCHACGYTTTFWYIGRNLCHNNGENAVDLKEVTDVIVTENVAYNFDGWGAGSGGSGVAFVAHYGPSNPPKRVWFLYNKVYDVTGWFSIYFFNYYLGAGFTTTGGVEDVFFVGNLVYNAAYGFRSWSCLDQAIVGNTIHNCDKGIEFEGGETIILTIENNIISETTDVEIELDYSQFRENALLNNNLFFRTTGSIDVDGTCNNCFEEDPLFVDASNGNFHIEENSPARNNATTDSAIYQTFYDTFHSHFSSLGSNDRANIKFGIEGKMYGDNWDIGAFQYDSNQPSQTTTEQPDPSVVIVVVSVIVVLLIVAAGICIIITFIVIYAKKKVSKKQKGCTKVDSSSESEMDELRK